MGEPVKIYKIKSVDSRPFFIPKLFLYKNGISIKKGIEIKVTEKEKCNLLKMKNGNNPSFVEVTEEIKQRRRTENSEV